MSDLKQQEQRPKYWVACSGGLDSVVLVHVLHQLNKSIGILHMNFQLRGEYSNADEQFVKNLAIDLNIPFRSKKVDVFLYKTDKKSNTQLAARELRYAWFNKIIQEEKAVICLGHHADDQLENFLIQLERGASVRGLAGMRTFRKNFFRPLLHYSKEALRDLAIAQNWKWREDGSNQQTIYKRNWYRIVFIPEFLRSGTKKKTIFQLVEKYQQLDDFLTDFFPSEAQQQSITITWEIWNTWPQLIQQYFLRNYQISIGQLHEVNKLQTGIKGGKLVYNSYTLWNEGSSLSIQPTIEEKDVSLEIRMECIDGNAIDFTTGELYVDLDKVKGKLKAAYWSKGDCFQPLGMKGHKLVSDFLIDRKVPAHQKQEVVVIKDDEKIIGIYGFGPSEQVKIDSSTSSHVKLIVT